MSDFAPATIGSVNRCRPCGSSGVDGSTDAGPESEMDVAVSAKGRSILNHLTTSSTPAMTPESQIPMSTVSFLFIATPKGSLNRPRGEGA